MYKKRLVFWAACIGILFFGMAITTLGSVVPQLKIKFQLDDISAGTLFSILPFGILIGSLFFGRFATGTATGFCLRLLVSACSLVLKE